VSKTCLVRFDNNKYSVSASAVGRPVEIHAYADRVVIRQDGRIVAEHPRCYGRGETMYDPWHYVPVLARKPGALRNGAPFKDRPGSSIPRRGKAAAIRSPGRRRTSRVGAIVRALDGPLAPISCASVTAFRPCADCRDLKTCPVRLIMVEARNAIADVLDNRTLAEMRMLADPADLEATHPI